MPNTPGATTFPEGARAHSASPVWQAYQILHFGFVALPVIAGADKFIHLLTDWDMYLSGTVARMLPISAHHFMMLAGVIEIIAGLVVALRPRIGGYIVTLWLWAIVINLLMSGSFFDIALRDFGLSLGAIALARLAAAEQHA